MPPHRLPPTDPVTEDLLHRYRVHMERRGNLPGSIRQRLNCLRLFTRSVSPLNLLDATRDDIESFLDSRRGRGGQRSLSARSRYIWISHLHAFYVWAVNEEVVAKDPTLAIVRPRMRRTLPRPIDDASLADAIDQAPPQMRAILTLAAYQGLRCQEIAGIDRVDVIEKKMLLRVVRGKGEKQRIIPLHPTVLEALRCLPMPRSGAVFLRPRGERFDGRSMSMAISTYFESIGIEATAHQLRHWFATEVYAASHDIRLTQELLGHQSPNTTAIYVAFSAVDAVAAVNSLRVVDRAEVASG